MLSKKTNNGGAPYNVLKDLALLGAPFPLTGAGLIGDDESGRFVLEDIHKYPVDISRLHVTPHADTGSTDVMTVASTGRRTFFHNRGANALFGPDNVDLDVPAKIFHMGYLLLLDKMDQMDGHGRTSASHLFEAARAQGFKTSVDVVSEASDRFATIVPPTLPFIDYLFVNEFEASRISGIEIMENGQFSMNKAERAIGRLFEFGVRSWVMLHFKGGAVAGNSSGQYNFYPALDIPDTYLRGTAGAGDAFAAGMLYGLHEDWPIRACLQLATCTAAASLADETCSAGISTVAEVLQLEKKFGFQS